MAVRVSEGQVFDVTALAPTTADLLEREDTFRSIKRLC